MISTDGTTHYTVQQAETTCVHQCLLQCVECNICIHQFICTCMDHLTLSTICKHIHLIAYTFVKNSGRTCTSIKVPDERAVLLKSLHTVHNTYDNKEKLRQSVSILLTHIETCTDMEKLKTTYELLQRAIILHQTDTTSQTFPSTQQNPSNKRITRQKPFFSTKRKRESTRIKIAKPTREESRKMVKDLLKGTRVHGVGKENISQHTQG